MEEEVDSLDPQLNNNGPSYSTEHDRRFPGAAVRKIGYVPSTQEIFAAYGWRVGAQSIPDLDLVGKDAPSEARIQLVQLLFPTPMEANTQFEIRTLICKVVIADGLWNNFCVGANFADYKNEEGERIYSDSESRDLGLMFEQALNTVGHLALITMTSELLETLLLPG